MEVLKCSLLTAILLLHPPSMTSSSTTECLSRLVRMSLAKVLQTGGDKVLESIPLEVDVGKKVYCATVCNDRIWCHFWCQDPMVSHCLLSNMYVTPGYAESDLSDAINCYTHRLPDYVTGAGIEAYTTHVEFPQRVKENLIDGLYTFTNLRECYKSENFTHSPYFVLDFHAPIKITRMVLLAQIGPTASQLQNIEIRIGDSPATVPGDFSSYSVFVTYAGPATSGEEIVFNADPPVTAQFLSVQRPEAVEAFQICHFEVN